LRSNQSRHNRGRFQNNDNADGDNYYITPLFVSVTPSLQLTDHEGQPAGGASLMPVP
jgi:hypothetical protein